MLELPEKPKKPTMYFIGVTTSESFIQVLFPHWVKTLGIDAQLEGIDVKIHADDEVYRKVVDFIKENEMAKGALVTTHKIDIIKAAGDKFDKFGQYASLFGEISCISKEDGKLVGSAKDPITSGLSLEAFLPENFWKKHGGEAFIMGAGGSGRALSSYLVDPEKGDNIPSKLVVTNRTAAKLDEFDEMIREVNPDINIEYRKTTEPYQNDAALKLLPPHSLIVNATGMGKDIPGSPISDQAEFPPDSYAWEFNYRGERKFMHQALAQKEEKNLYVEDGWIYFIHGWTEVIKDVFDLEIDEQTFEELTEVATKVKKEWKK